MVKALKWYMTFPKKFLPILKKIKNIDFRTLVIFFFLRIIPDFVKTARLNLKIFFVINIRDKNCERDIAFF